MGKSFCFDRIVSKFPFWEVIYPIVDSCQLEGDLANLNERVLNYFP